jgi:hypothetical protein
MGIPVAEGTGAEYSAARSAVVVIKYHCEAPFFGAPQAPPEA